MSQKTESLILPLALSSYSSEGVFLYAFDPISSYWAGVDMVLALRQSRPKLGPYPLPRHICISSACWLALTIITAGMSTEP